MVIAHNISAINTYKSLGMSGGSVNKAMEKLASGFRINKAADDAAGLSISEKMRSQIRGLNQASKNAENGISLIQTAEGALNEVHSILQRMRELAVQSATDTNAQDDRNALQSEMEQLFNEIDRIGQTTEYNGMKILYGEHIPTEVKGFTGGLRDTKAILGESFDKGYTTEVVDVGKLRISYPWESNNEVESSEHTVATIDLSQINSASDVEALKGKGFSATCKGCSAYLAIKFVDGTGLKVTPIDGVNFGDSWASGTSDYNRSNVYEIGIDGCSTGEDVVKRVMENIIEMESKMIGNNTDVSGGIDMSDYGITNQHRASFHNPPYQDTDGGYRFVSSTAYINKGSTVTNELINHMVMIGAEYSDGNYGSTLVVGDPRGDFRDPETTPTGYDPEDPSANCFSGIKSGVYGTHNVYEVKNVDLHFHVGANSNQTIHVELSSISCQDLELGTLNTTDGTFSRFNILTRSNANTAINKIDNAIKSVSKLRSTFGAIQNRLEYTINNLNTTGENMTAAESTIRDVDMADQMMEYTKSNILQQAAQAMLIQANSRPQQALQLLRV